MKEHILELKKEYKFVYEEINILNNKELFRKYKDKIPVLLLNGRLFAKYEIDSAKKDLLKKYLV